MVGQCEGYVVCCTMTLSPLVTVATVRRHVPRIATVLRAMEWSLICAPVSCNNAGSAGESWFQSDLFMAADRSLRQMPMSTNSLSKLNNFNSVSVLTPRS